MNSSYEFGQKAMGSVAGTGIAYAGSPQAATRVPEVEAQLSELGEQLKLAEDYMEQLGGRLQGVVRSVGLKGGSDQPTPESVLVPIAGRLRECVRRMQSINGKFGYLLANIEL